MTDDTPKSASRLTLIPERPKTPAAPLPAAPPPRVLTPPDATPSQRPIMPVRTWPEVVDAAIDGLRKRDLREGDRRRRCGALCDRLGALDARGADR